MKAPKSLQEFPDDEELRKVYEDVDKEADDPDGGENPPLLGLILLTALIYKKIRERNGCGN